MKSCCLLVGVVSTSLKWIENCGGLEVVGKMPIVKVPVRHNFGIVSPNSAQAILTSRAEQQLSVNSIRV